MAPRKQTETTSPIPPAPTAIPMTTVSGFAVSILAFIPIGAKDLRKQAEIPMLLLDIQEGKKTIADLAPYLKNPEFRQQHLRKRFTQEEAAELLGTATKPLLEGEDANQGQQEESGDQNGETGDEEDRDQDGEDLQSLMDRDRE